MERAVFVVNTGKAKGKEKKETNLRAIEKGKPAAESGPQRKRRRQILAMDKQDIQKRIKLCAERIKPS